MRTSIACREKGYRPSTHSRGHPSNSPLFDLLPIKRRAVRRVSRRWEREGYKPG